ncbi:MAG: hypothetical protein DGJ47_001014 [Rickettsiaceae bacterium]
MKYNDAKLLLEKLIEKTKLIITQKEFQNSNVIPLFDKINQFMNELELNSNSAKLLQVLDNKVFKKLVKRHFLLQQKSLATLFYSIATLNYTKSLITNEAQHYIDGASYCLYTCGILDDVKNIFKKQLSCQELRKNNYKLLSNLYSALINRCTLLPNLSKYKIFDKQSINDFSRKETILNIRESTNREIEKAINYRNQKKDKLYVDITKNIFANISDTIKNYLSGLYETAEKLIGLPPCQYAVVGLGSMSSQQITLYSDLEFCILTANEEYKDSSLPKIREYFTNLSYLVCFQNICLGETVVPISHYDSDLDYVIQAINFDLGGKTPLGRKNKPYDLIQTVDKIALYLTDIQKFEHIDKNITILQQFCFVYGSQNLFDEYQIKVQEIMNFPSVDDPTMTNAQYNAYKTLQIGATEINYIDSNKDLHAETKITGNLEQFNPEFHNSVQGQLFNAKQNIYRLPDRFLYQLIKFFNLYSNNIWDALDRLKDSNKISEIGCLNLKKTLSFAVLLRAQIYHYYGYQKESIASVGKSAKKSEKKAKLFRLSNLNLKSDGEVFEFFYSAKELYRILLEHCKYIDSKSQDTNYMQIDIRNESFYDDSIENQFQICGRLMLWQQAKTMIENKLQACPNLAQKNQLINVLYASCCHKLKEYDKAKIFFDKYLEHTTNHPIHNDIRARIYIDFGIESQEKGKFKEALDYFNNSLKIVQSMGENTDNNLLITAILMIGSAYHNTGRCNDALKQYDKALDICNNNKIANIQSMKGVIYSNKGIAYRELGQYKESFKFLRKSLNIYRESLGNRHLFVAAALNNLALAHFANTDYIKTELYSLKSIRIMKNISLGNHPCVGVFYNILALSYFYQQKYADANKYAIKSWKIYKNTSLEESADAALTVNTMGLIMQIKEQHNEALKRFNHALVILDNLGKTNPSEKLQIISNAIEVSKQMGKYGIAIRYAKKELEILKIHLKDDIKIGLSLNQIGFFYRLKEQYKEALKYYNESLATLNKCIEGANLDKAAVIHNIAAAYILKKDVKKAIPYLDQSEQMFKACQAVDNLKYAFCLNDIGIVLHHKGKNKKAKKYYQKALKMYKDSGNENHPDTQILITNIEALDKGESMSLYSNPDEAILDLYSKSNDGIFGKMAGKLLKASDWVDNWAESDSE